MAENKSDFRLPRPASLKLRADLAKRAISASVLARVEGLFAQWDADPRILVDRKTSQVMSDHGPTYQNVLEDRGELDVVQVDGRVRVVVDSIYRRLILKMVATYGADGDLKKMKPAPANMLRVRAEHVKAARKRVLERELAAKRSPIKRAKKPSEVSPVPAE